MKQAPSIFFHSLFSLVLLFLSACAKADVSLPNAFPAEARVYEKQGLKRVYPASWQPVHDGKGIIADRYIEFDTPSSSSLSLMFYKTFPRTLADIDTKARVQRKAQSIGGFKSLQLSWESHLLTEGKNQANFVQIQEGPFSVFAQFLLFGEDIKKLQQNIVLFLNGISID